MRYIAKNFKARQHRHLLDNYYWQLWFRYHTLFFGSIIFSGNKLRAFDSFIFIKQGLKKKEFSDPYFIFLVSMMMVTPNIFLLPIRLGGRSLGVPMPVHEKKKVSLGVRFVLTFLKVRRISLSIKNVIETLVSSIYAKGPAIDKKLSVYRLASQNRHLLKLFR